METSRLVFYMLCIGVMVAICQGADDKCKKFNDGWMSEKCTGLLRLNPKTCTCSETCNGYGRTFRKLGPFEFFKRYTSGVNVEEEIIKNKNRYAVCKKKCEELKKFTCTAFTVVSFENQEYICQMVDKVVPLGIRNHVDAYIRDCHAEPNRKQLLKEIENLKRMSELLDGF